MTATPVYPVGIIGGTGLTSLPGLVVEGETRVATDWGEPSAPLVRGQLNGQPVIFLARHGNPHRIPPHQVNYRANVMALYQAGVRTLIGVNAVGGIHPDMGPARVVIPDQIIDYTWGRGSTFFEGKLESVTHIDFTWPYDAEARRVVIGAAREEGVAAIDSGVYGATQGPRLETAAEIRRMERDGCDLVGMTGMPEAALAAELGMRYVCLALVVNRAAGKTEQEITMEDIEAAIARGMTSVRKILVRSVASLGGLTPRPRPA